MSEINKLKLFFIINPGSGNNNTDFKPLIEDYMKSSLHEYNFYKLENNIAIDELKKIILDYKPDRVVSVGGDGTVNLIAKCLLKSEIPIGILPAGSANGMAKELAIPADMKEALDIITTGRIKKIHAIMVNEKLCIHLCDIGFNAFIIKKFETLNKRGMWGYTKSFWKVLWQNYRLDVIVETDNKRIKRSAAMVVIANATQYGTGVVINPEGKLNDHLFEVIVIRKLSLTEILKMKLTHKPYNSDKTELFHTSSLEIKTNRKAHFQIDGEYLGKVNELRGIIIPEAINFIVPSHE